MDATRPGLFELPDLDQPGTSERSRCGRNREIWSLTATAALTVVDAGALQEAYARAEEEGVTINLPADPQTCEPQDSDGMAPTTGSTPSPRSFGQPMVSTSCGRPARSGSSRWRARRWQRPSTGERLPGRSPSS